MLGLHCYAGLSLVAASRGYSLVEVFRLFTAVVSPVSEQRLWSAISVVVAHRLSCPDTCGIFLDQGSSLHSHEDSYPLDHQVNPKVLLN